MALEDGNYVYLFYILPDQTVIKRILIGPMAFRERELCVVILHSAGPDSYLALL